MKENMVPSGTWVQISEEVLAPDQRAPQVPEDTSKTPMVLLVKGFLEHAALIGQRAKITTLSGRTLEGELVEALPRYIHDFGDAIPELLEIGPRIRRMLEGGEHGDR